MKERLVKGDLLVPIVRMLKAKERATPMPEIGAWERDLLKRRIAPSTWYALQVFDSLLQTAHRFVLDGSEAAARTLGTTFAHDELAALAEGSAPAPFDTLPSRWRAHFNFGAAELREGPAQPGERLYILRVTGYPDMSACLGHAITGYVSEHARRAGMHVLEARVDERPWMHHSVLTLALRVQG